MNVKIKSALVVAALALVAMTGFVTTVYSDDADADPIGTVNIEIDQTYTYDVIFNVSTAVITSVTVDAAGDGKFTATNTGNAITIKGVAVGAGTFEIAAKSNEISANTTTQTVPVNVVATLSITTDSLTFYQDVAGTKQYVRSSNDILTDQEARTGDVVYSAKGLPAGLHMDAGGYGLIYGKATTVAATTVNITATNLSTGVIVTKNITVNVLGNASDFTLTAGTNVTKDPSGIRYYVTDSSATYDFTSSVTGGNWSAMASKDFSDVVNFSATGDKLTFTPTGSNFALSGDYVVTIFHEVGGLTTEQSVVMHFQTGLLFDTVPKASIQVSYTGASFIAV